MQRAASTTVQKSTHRKPKDHQHICKKILTANPNKFKHKHSRLVPKYIVATKDSCILRNEPYLLSKEPDILSKKPYILSIHKNKRPVILASLAPAAGRTRTQPQDALYRYFHQIEYRNEIIQETNHNGLTSTSESTHESGISND